VNKGREHNGELRQRIGRDSKRAVVQVGGQLLRRFQIVLALPAERDVLRHDPLEEFHD
jgi:hypothetical protein